MEEKKKIKLSKQLTKDSTELKSDTMKTDKRDKTDLLSQDEQRQERVTEKLSISVPVQPLQRPTGVMAYAGQRVRLLLRDGTVVIGFLQKRIWNYAHLLNVEETGKDFKVTADWCDVDLGTIARIYPATAQAGPISRPQG